MRHPRIGFVSITRPLFKGDTGAVLRRSLAGLEALADEFAFELVLGAPARTRQRQRTRTRTGGTSRDMSAKLPQGAQASAAGARVLVVSDGASAERAAALMGEQDLDLLLVQLTTFATGEVLAPLLGAAPRVGLWGVPERMAGRGTSGPLPLNSLCGLSMGMSIAGRARAPVSAPTKWFYGEPESAAFRARLSVTVAASRGLAALRGAKVLAIGGTAPGFYRLDEMPDSLCVKVEQRPLPALFERIAAVPEADAAVRAAEWAAGEVSEVTQEQLRRAARIDLALAGMARDAGADALAVRCWPELPDTCDSMACLAMADQAERQVPAACEGDVMGALSMLALQAVSRSPAILMDLSDTDGPSDSLLLWHCGNAPVAWATATSGSGAGTRLTTHFNRDGVGVVRDLHIRPGTLTGFRLLDGGRSAVVVGGRVDREARAGFDGVRGWLTDLRWAGAELDVGDFVANLLDRRLPHHLAFGLGEHHHAMMELCGYLGAEVLPVRDARPYLRA